MPRRPSTSSRMSLPRITVLSWARFRDHVLGAFEGADVSALIAFWLFGIINNVSYVIILSAALDLVGPAVPKGIVLLADILPAFILKLIAPYYIHHLPYSLRIIIMCALSASGMLLIALTPSVVEDGGSVAVKLVGVAFASLSSGGGEVSLLALTHYYGTFALAAWSSGTGAAGLVGAGLYALLTVTIGLSVRSSLLISALLPFIMPLAFFFILPQWPLHWHQEDTSYSPIPSVVAAGDEDTHVLLLPDQSSSPSSSSGTNENTLNHDETHIEHSSSKSITPKAPRDSLIAKLNHVRTLFIPYMLPLLIVYVSEYTINQGITPSLLFPLSSTPLPSYGSFYPIYAFLYQLGVFVSRSSSPFIRLHNLYTLSLLQFLNFGVLVLQSVYAFVPSVWIIFAIIFWEGLLGGGVYVNTFAEIIENVELENREFSLAATSVSDSAGILLASIIGIVIEGPLCDANVQRGRPWCRDLE